MNVSRHYFILLPMLIMCGLGISRTVHAAQGVTANEDVLKRMAVDYKVQSLDGAAIGELIGLQRGSLTFKTTDLHIKGNGPDIIISRSYKGENYSYHHTVDMADWSLDIPHIYTTVASVARNTSGPWGKYKACSESIESEPMFYYASGKHSSIEPNAFHHGDFLFSHESGTENLYENTPGNFGSNITRITKSNWKFECIQTQDSLGQRLEGFVGYSPAGLKYTFNKSIRDRIQTASLSGSSTSTTPAPLVPVNPFYLHAMYLYVSKVEDRFGRAIEYQYDGNRLMSIVATDGRKVDVEYDPASMHRLLPRIKAVTYADRRIGYQYETHPRATTPSLVRVDIGENLFWQYQLHETSAYYPNGNNDAGGQTNCARTPLFSGPNGSFGNVSVRHPAGFKVHYELQCTFFGRANVPPKVATLQGDEYITPYRYGELSVKKKTLEYDNGKSYVWQYQYSGNLGYATDQTLTDAHRLSGINLPAGLLPELLNATTTILPDGSTTISVYDRSFTSGTEGSLVYEVTKDNTGQMLSANQSKYAHARAIGWNGVFGENSQVSSYDIAATETIRQIFYQNQSTQYRTLFSDFDLFGNSRKKTEFLANESQAKHTKTTYFHDLTHWILSQPATSSISDNDLTYLQTEEYKYYPSDVAAKSSLMEYLSYRRQVYRLDYHPDGNVSRKTYNLANRWVSFHDYQLGSPKRVEFPDRYDANKISAVALNYDPFGNVIYTTDFNGNSTQFFYDNIGRLELIDPVSDSIANTVIRYASLDNFRSQQIVEKGNFRAQIQYDGLRRAMLATEWDAANEANTRKQQFKNYDENNAILFESHFLSEANGQSPGTNYQYDGLGRLKSTQFANGYRETIDYLSGHEIRHTNAKMQSKTTTYLAYGAPAYDMPLQIEQPENINTALTYNIAGQLTSITQGGYQETRVYDDYMQLCLQKRPETGVKALRYNTLGQISQYAEGLSGNASHCQDYQNIAANWVTSIYDHQGEQHQQIYADAQSPSTMSVLDAQGNLKTLTANGTLWRYTYNAAHQVETETLEIDGKSYVLDPSYNELGHLTRLTYAGATLEFSPDAMGRPTSVHESSTRYASDIKYYPGGQLKSFHYGNGVVFSQTLDDMQRPLDLVNAKNGQMKTAQSYRYDANDNVADIYDLTNASHDIHLTYDDADRLETARGSWGMGDFGYDSTGNLSWKNLGAQRLSYDYHPTTKRLRSVSGIPAATYQFDYDDRGNVTHNGIRGFQFNRANQLTHSGSIGYLYDGYNRRVKKIAGSPSYSVYNKNGQLQLTDGVLGITRYIYLGNQLIARVGNTIAAEDKPGYTGHLEDDDLQLTYMQQRYYDPVIGRFYSNDPVGFTASNPMMFNRYAYANNNPYKYTDPDGRAAFLAPLFTPQGMALAAATIAAVGQGIKGTLNALSEDASESGNSEDSGGVIIDDKVKDQLGDRGWTEQEVKDLVGNTKPTGTSTDNRRPNKTEDRKGRNDPASVYGSKKGGHVVVNDNTNEVTHVSDKTDENWIPDSRIKWNEEQQ